MFEQSRPLYSLTVGEFIKLLHLVVKNEKLQSTESVSEKDLLDIQEAADYLKLAVATLYSLNSRKKIPYVRVTGKIYYRRSALDDWLASGERKTIAQLKREVMGGNAQ